MNVKMEPPTESDSMEDHPVNDDVPTDVSEADDSATQNTVERPKYPSRPTGNRRLDLNERLR